MCVCVRVCVRVCHIFPGNCSNDFLEILHEVGNPELMKSERSRFLNKSHPPPFWAQKGQIWAKIALFHNLGKNGSNDFFQILNNEYQNGYEKNGVRTNFYVRTPSVRN